MKPIWIMGAMVAAALFASGITYVLISRAAETRPAAKITHVDIDAETLARALGLPIYAFELPIPDQECSLNVWLERWTRDAQEPQIVPISTTLSLVGEGSGKLTVCLPTTNHPDFFETWSTRGGKTFGTGGAAITPIDSAVSSAGKAAQVINMKEISGYTFIEPRAMALGQDIPLMALQYTKSGLHEGGTEHVEKDNDVTWYLRARFSPGKSYHGLITWKDGKIDIQ